MILGLTLLTERAKLSEIKKKKSNQSNEIIFIFIFGERTQDFISMAPCTSMVTKQEVVIVVPNSHIPTKNGESKLTIECFFLL